MEPQLVDVGQFCPNEECEFYQDLAHAKIIKYGTTAKGDVFPDFVDSKISRLLIPEQTNSWFA